MNYGLQKITDNCIQIWGSVVGSASKDNRDGPFRGSYVISCYFFHNGCKYAFQSSAQYGGIKNRKDIREWIDRRISQALAGEV